MNILDRSLPAIGIVWVCMLGLVLVYYKYRFPRWLLLLLGSALGAILGGAFVFVMGVYRLPWFLAAILVSGGMLLAFQVYWMYSSLLMRSQQRE